MMECRLTSVWFEYFLDITWLFKYTFFKFTTFFPQLRIWKSKIYNEKDLEKVVASSYLNGVSSE